MTTATTFPATVSGRPPRSVAWLLLAGAAAAVLLVGLTTTAVLLSRLATDATTPAFWTAFAVASGLTIASLGLRALRWVFLLRRVDNTRIPILDAYIGYFSGLTLLLAPLLLGEIAIRAWVLRARAGVPPARTAFVNVWERLLDLTALLAIAGAVALIVEGPGFSTGMAIGIVAATFVPAARAIAARSIAALVQPLERTSRAGRGAADVRRLHATRTWSVALAVSVAAWLLPGLGLWAFFRAGVPGVGALAAELAYARSTIAGALVLAPGGVVVAGTRLIDALVRGGFDSGAAALAVFGIRMATAGVATAFGAVFLAVHLRRRAADSATHFDDIASEYDVQIPEARRVALVGTKTALMREVLETRGVGRRGLDVGCGQGWYVARMRELGYDVAGIDSSAAQIARARDHVPDPGAFKAGSMLNIPAAAGEYDFVYTINVLHHLASVEEQRAAFAEMLRVLHPGGLLFVHEINTTNVLFRFYMGYIFPSLNCIDEGVERWLLPRTMDIYTGAPMVDVRYFTFLPDFMPAAVVRMLAPIERRLERSALNVYSAHYMAVFQKKTA
ncbi:MAG TPA: methyltransferase domain-containing protein [Vicinamibacterales bacterium]|nr:methyltransferase domain-containing protein [Vicinamibacterales bacterium]